MHALTTVEQAQVVISEMNKSGRATILGDLLRATDREGRTPEVVARQRGFVDVATLLRGHSQVTGREPDGAKRKFSEAGSLAPGEAHAHMEVPLADLAAHCSQGKADWQEFMVTLQHTMDFVPLEEVD